MNSWTASKLLPRPSGLLTNPYYEWAVATDFAYYGRSAKGLPVLIELRERTAQEFARHVVEVQKVKEREQGWAAELRVPPFFADPPKRLAKPLRFISVLATRKFLSGINAGEAPFELFSRFELGRATMPATLRANPGNRETPMKFADLTPVVITGVIDDGIAFAHNRFHSTNNTTRIEYFWDQREPSTLWPYWPDWDYGREISKRDPNDGIDTLMQTSKYVALVDEDEVYRRSTFLDFVRPGHKPLAERVSHGAHVMDVACQVDPLPAQGTRPIIAVQLPSATVADTSGATLGPQVFDGLCYFIFRAATIASAAQTGQLPVVVNVSYGTIAGPHDGSSPFEVALDHLLDCCNPLDANGYPITPPFRVVLPAGNNHLSRCHACVSLDPGQHREIAWRVLPDDWTESYVEIWLPNGASALTFNITAPDGQTTGAFSAGNKLVYGSVAGPVATVFYYPPGLVGPRALVWFGLAPTGAPDGGLPVAPAGVWRIGIDNPGVTPVDDIEAWIQRDDSAPGYARRGRQSYFDDPAYGRYDDGGREIEDDADPRTIASYVKRAGTLNAIATGREPVVIGGFRRSDSVPAKYSASGPVVHPPGRGSPNDDGPDAMAPSEDAPSHRGVLAAGTRSGSCAAMNGTSVAAPRVARLLAERMVVPLPSDRKAVFDLAATFEVGRTDTPPPQLGGGGRIPSPPDRLPR